LPALRELGADVLYCPGDIASREDRINVLAAITNHFGRLNVLVNNAGVAPKERRDILEATEESFEYVLSTNLRGPYFLTQKVANWMIDQGRKRSDFTGCIINISSVSATVASVNRGEYCIAKAGVSMATQLFAARLGEYNIPVYEVRPGIIKTDMTAGVTEKYDRLIDGGLTVQKRWGYPRRRGQSRCRPGPRRLPVFHRPGAPGGRRAYASQIVNSGFILHHSTFLVRHSIFLFT
jgi:NAD(P)-dependent dehydrogenase (short-subunit alcohol dehydrogenase family)